ncbi:putative JAB1/MPN/MOV34 metalloenzyme domain, COP9 signalosome subunit 6 protein [Rosa chinensis]|uniref:Putative JAB1/MPN/MOV34 metalloenzyme domain, COP9 signalosome subunit 6 protein n=1 Tax=Rosa chinensis TaxID=74649 RepID=A0A2P6QL59_ROSCH|nr:putative JAB1/MPN/MOV34 metalloenzyme domain, COP9 signalosome subunit 6 protein [Rosa chinensis]
MLWPFHLGYKIVGLSSLVAESAQATIARPWNTVTSKKRSRELGKPERRKSERKRERERESLKPPNRRRMAESSSSGLTFKLHPLVMVNISDHYSRVKSQMNPPIAAHNATATTTTTTTNNGAEAVEMASSSSSSSASSPRVFGCVIGVQRGRTVEIFNSFELLYDPETHSLERGFLEKKQELCR